jgi:ATP-dependent Lon protease
MEELLQFAVEGRKRVKDQLMRIDTTYGKVRFAYLDAAGKQRRVSTLEEEEYPAYYGRTATESEADPAEETHPEDAGAGISDLPPSAEPVLKEQHLTFQENQKGVSFDALFGPYLRGATRITITDPYIRLFYQIRNLMELVETVVKLKARDEEVAVHLVTVEDEFKGEQQKEQFEKIKTAGMAAGIHFTWEFDGTGALHARHIVTDHGWKISLDRGLDIFQHYEMNDAFAFANRLQAYRQCKAFEATFIKS